MCPSLDTPQAIHEVDTVAFYERPRAVGRRAAHSPGGGGGGIPVSARELRAVLPACTVHCPHPTAEQGISAASHFPWRH